MTLHHAVMTENYVETLETLFKHDLTNNEEMSPFRAQGKLKEFIFHHFGPKVPQPRTKYAFLETNESIDFPPSNRGQKKKIKKSVHIINQLLILM